MKDKIQFSSVWREASTRNSILFLLIFAVAVFFRLYHLGKESLWLDEVFSVHTASRSFLKVLFNQDVHPPLYLSLLHFWVRLFGTSEEALRSLSVVFGLLSVGLAYKIGAFLFDAETGLLASLFLALSNFHIMYSQEARSYTMLCFLSMASFYFFFKYYQQRRFKDMTLYFLTSFLLLYTHNFGAFVILGENLYVFSILLARNKLFSARALAWAGLQAVLFILYLPWLLFTRKYTMALKGNYWITKPSFLDLVKTLREFAGGYRLLITSLMIVVFLVWTQYRDRKKPGASEFLEKTYFLVVWFGVTLLTPFLISLFWMPIYYIRYVIASYVAVYLLVARGIRVIPSTLIRGSLVLSFILLSLAGIFLTFSMTCKEEWRDVARGVDTTSVSGDLLVFHSVGRGAFDYYSQRKDRDEIEFPIQGRDAFSGEKEQTVNEKNASQFDKIVRSYQRVWLILSHPHDETHQLEKILEGRYSIVLHRKYVGIEVLLFKAKPIPV